VLAWPERIEAVPREAVIEATRRYLRPDRSVTGLLLPVA
jgi:zinc protease